MARPAKRNERADYIKEISANRDHRSEVDRKLASLKGQSRAELEADNRRAASSPLGHGTGSQPMRRGRKRLDRT